MDRQSKRGSASGLSNNSKSKIAQKHKNVQKHEETLKVEDREADSSWEENGKYKTVKDERLTPLKKLELNAYASVLRAFRAQAAVINWTKERILCELRISLGISQQQHRAITKEFSSVARQDVKGSTSEVHSGDVKGGRGPPDLIISQAKLQLPSTSGLDQKVQMLPRGDKRPHDKAIADYDQESGTGGGVKRRSPESTPDTRNSAIIKNLPRKADENSIQKPVKKEFSQA